MCVFVCTYIPLVWVPTEARRGCWIALAWSYRWIWESNSDLKEQQALLSDEPHFRPWFCSLSSWPINLCPGNSFVRFLSTEAFPLTLALCWLDWRQLVGSTCSRPEPSIKALGLHFCCGLPPSISEKETLFWKQTPPQGGKHSTLQVCGTLKDSFQKKKELLRLAGGPRPSGVSGSQPDISLWQNKNRNF